MSRPIAKYRAMTDAEQEMAIALGTVNVGFATWSIQFKRAIAEAARRAEPLITDAQAASLRTLVRRFRKQIPASIVAFAGPEPTLLPQHDLDAQREGRRGLLE